MKPATTVNYDGWLDFKLLNGGECILIRIVFWFLFMTGLAIVDLSMK